MSNTINGFNFINGSGDGFSVDNIPDYEKNTLYFIRTDADGEEGYLYINGKKYGQPLARTVADYMTFEALEDTTFSFKKNGTGNDIQYSLDEGDTWVSLPSETPTPTVAAGERIMWKSEITPLPPNEGNPGVGIFTSTGRCNLHGNPMSLLYGDNFEGKELQSEHLGAFACLFADLETINYCKIVDAYNFKLNSKNVPQYGYSYMFSHNADLVVAPNITAETVGDMGCYSMFALCSALIYAPRLSANTLGVSAYAEMFFYCTNLTSTPELPATTLGTGCYNTMFASCSKLTSVQPIKATALSENCYGLMFSGCTSLTSPPSLPATTLAVGCYGGMFLGCTKLTTAPTLRATVLTEYCYNSMFERCTSLTSAPELPAETLVTGCYSDMFSGCTKLNYIKMTATDVSATDCLLNWVSNVAATGTFVEAIESPIYIIGPSGVPQGWVVEDNAIDKYLTFEALEDTTFTFTKSGLTNDIEYSTDGGAVWTKLASGTETPTIPNGSKIIWKATKTTSDSTDVGIGNFGSTGKFKVYGNIHSIVRGVAYRLIKNFSGKRAFEALFANCTGITDASRLVLPSKQLDWHQYREMFSGCTNLTKAPSILPCETVADYCYKGMFNGCTSLTDTPVLPAKTLGFESYREMFSGCAMLPTAPELPATELNEYCYRGMFKGCTNLTTAPELPATTLSNHCYQYMFSGCTNLISAPHILPSTILHNQCYDEMFVGCTRLTTAPELPATTLAIACYSGMFKGCTHLTTAPELPATTLANACYSGMFKGCTHLTTAPELPATTLAQSCYYGMFQGCTHLTTAPELPATILAESCYEIMFYGCENLTKSPVLPAKTLVTRCYTQMFVNSFRLNNVTILATDISAEECMYAWLSNVASHGVMFKREDLNMPNGISGLPYGWNITNYEENNPHLSYLTFEAIDNDVVFGFKKLSESNDNIQYSKDNGTTWSTLSSDEGVTVLAGDKVLWKSTLLPSNNGIGYFTTSNTFKAYGNVMSLLFGDGFVGQTDLTGKDCAFKDLFMQVGGYLLDVSNLVLPAKTLSHSCYYQMFNNCTSLTTAPKLPATTFGEYCCTSMFLNCTSLTTAPELPATTLAKNCYAHMFNGCTSLTTAPELPATTLAQGCYANMFQGCTSLTTAPELPATTLTDNCYEHMFVNCTSLTTAPELPATTLAYLCYYAMFANCTNLTTAPELPATTLAQTCYVSMFVNCTSLTTPPELPATTLTNSCYNAMFSGCTSLTTAPELHATTLASQCYSSMFRGCTNLKYITMLGTDISEYYCLNHWVEGVSSTGTFIKNPDMDSLPTATADNDYEGIPEGWNVYDNTYENKYTTFEALEDAKFGLTNGYSGLNMQYSLNNGCTWVTLPMGEFTPTIKPGKKVLWKCTTTSLSQIGTFTSNGKFKVYGNIGSLRSGDGFINGNPSALAKSAGFRSLFDYNTFLTDASNLIIPDNFMSANAYQRMFAECNNLTTAPKLTATKLNSNCYDKMFYHCGKLNYIYLSATDISASGCLRDWVYGVASTGTFVKNEELYGIEIGVSGIPEGWTVNNTNGSEYAPLNETPTTFIAVDDCTFSNAYVDYQYSLDNGSTWNTLSTNTQSPTVNAGNKIMWRATSDTTDWRGSFESTGRFKVIGNSMSLLFNTDFTNKNHLIGYSGVFYSLFSSNTGLTEAKYFLFPAITIDSNAYAAAFLGCTNLTKAPSVLPATTLGMNCYASMFSGCTSLTTAPELPATTLADYCYNEMFKGCTSLTTAPKLPATTLANGCYGTMFNGCTSLSTTIELKAHILKPSCYEGMFSGCTSLRYIGMFALTLDENSLLNWVSSVKANGTFYKHPEMTSLTTGVSGIPSGWTVYDKIE